MSGVHEGRVLRVVPSADPVTRRYEVKVSLPSGMFGRAQFYLGDESVLTVPAAAVVERGGLTGVFRVDDDGLIAFRWLRTRRSLDGALEVTAGVIAGDRVVLAPPADLRDGGCLVGVASTSP